jgi:hypothetical protein
VDRYTGSRREEFIHFIASLHKCIRIDPVYDAPRIGTIVESDEKYYEYSSREEKIRYKK